jgi:hypothetical protein
MLCCDGPQAAVHATQRPWKVAGRLKPARAPLAQPRASSEQSVRELHSHEDASALAVARSLAAARARHSAQQSRLFSDPLEVLSLQVRQLQGCSWACMAGRPRQLAEDE